MGAMRRPKEMVARAHYGPASELLSAWLDDTLMMYTCAYWREGTASLEEAQVNKIEHVCRKGLLREGETVIDIGCGFGGFMFHAAPRYGVKVTGTNTTTEQVAAVSEKIGAERRANQRRRSGFPREAGRVRQGRVDRRAGARGA